MTGRLGLIFLQYGYIIVTNIECWPKIYLVLFTDLEGQLFDILEEIVVVILVRPLWRVEEHQHQEYSIILLDRVLGKTSQQSHRLKEKTNMWNSFQPIVIFTFCESFSWTGMMREILKLSVTNGI